MMGSPWWQDRSAPTYSLSREQRMAVRRFKVALLRDPVFGAVWRAGEWVVSALAQKMAAQK